MRRAVRMSILAPVVMAVSVVGLILPQTAQAATKATAAVSPLAAFRGDGVGTTYTFTINNTSTAAESLGSVRVARPSPDWTITSCSGAPAGWTPSAPVAGSVCDYSSATGTGDNIAVNTSSSAFTLVATTTAGAADAKGLWTILVDANDTYNAGTNASKATGGPQAAVAYVWEITDATVTTTVKAIGSACPASVHSARASTRVTVAICGRNRGNLPATPVAANSTFQSNWGGNGTFASGSIPASSGNVVLANYTNTLVFPTVATGKFVITSIGSSATATSPKKAWLDWAATCTQTWTVDGVNGNDANAGDCTAPFKTITKATSVATSGQSISVKPATYDTALGETFPINVPAGVTIIGDVIHLGTQDIVSGSVNLGVGSAVLGLAITGVTTLANNSGIAYSVLKNPPADTNDTSKTCLNVNGTGVLITTVIAANCSTGAFVNMGKSAKIRNSFFILNNVGIRLVPKPLIGAGTNGIADLGTASDLGGNTLSCGINADLWSNKAAISAVGNKWDHNPPEQSALVSPVPLSGKDIVHGLAGSVNAAQSSLPPFDTSGCATLPLPI